MTTSSNADVRDVDRTEYNLQAPPTLVGRRLRHPRDNALVEIINADAEANWWNWRVVLPDGSLNAEVESGYGW